MKTLGYLQIKNFFSRQIRSVKKYPKVKEQTAARMKTRDPNESMLSYKSR